VCWQSLHGVLRALAEWLGDPLRGAKSLPLGVGACEASPQTDFAGIPRLGRIVAVLLGWDQMLCNLNSLWLFYMGAKSLSRMII
jgi:hypothetical protein